MRRYLLVLGALAIGAVAGAQAETDLSQAAVGFGFRFGGYWPVDSKLRNSANVWDDAAIEYDFQKSIMKTGTTYGAVDWISRNLFGGQHSAIISVNQRFYGGNHRFAAGGTPYFFVGVGAQFVDFNGNSGSSWMARGGIGSEFKGDWFLEAAGLVAPKVKGVDFSGISLSLGYRVKD